MKTPVIYLFAIAITLLCGCQGQNGPTVTKVKSSEVPAETRAERIMEDNPADVGTIPDSIDVNKSGEANYVIPLCPRREPTACSLHWRSITTVGRDMVISAMVGV